MLTRILYQSLIKVNLTRIVSSLIASNKIKESQINQIRFKYTKNTGVKGIRSGKKFENIDEEDKIDQDEIDLKNLEYDAVANLAMNVNRSTFQQNVFIIQPYVKWGQNKSKTCPDLQLQEAEALIRSLPQWTISHSLKVPLESWQKKTLFGSGKLEELKKLIENNSAKLPVTCLFISKGTLSFVQKRFLAMEFNLPVFDRYSIVIQILRLHATSAEAKLQVALAEVPYIWAQMKDANLSPARKQGYFLSDTQKEMLKKRERKLKNELEKIRDQRKLLRNKRKLKNIPIIAVVGYTNAGKTSLIKSLTNEKTMQPRDQLFATLDVTAHAGLLPCNLEVVYMDTVGFMSDIPTELIECFVATLEDAMVADLIIHVQDLSHENYLEQVKHVEKTLAALTFSIESEKNIPPTKIINVGNKIDLLNVNEKNNSNIHLVSSKTSAGIRNLLNYIEKSILEVTERKKITIRVKSGSDEMSWLYKNAAVTNSRADPNNSECILLEVVISDITMQRFKHYCIAQKS